MPSIASTRKAMRNEPPIYLASHHPSRLIPLILLTLSIILNIALSSKVRRLQAVIASLKNESRLKVNTTVPPIIAEDIDGHAVLINYSDYSYPTILYIFSPSCPWCRRNVRNIESLASQVYKQYHVVGLSLSKNDLKSYAREFQFTFPLYCEPSGETKLAFKIGGTPQTVVISAQSVVLANWVGAYDGSLRKEIEDYFGVVLPGLVNDF